MSDALRRLVQRVVAPETVLQARVPFLFEGGDVPAPPEAPPTPGTRHTVERVHTQTLRETNHEQTETHVTAEATHERIESTSSSEITLLERTENGGRASARPEPAEAGSTLLQRTERVEVPRFAALLPSPAPAPRTATIVRNSVSAPAEQTVEITIGRIDVRAVTAPQTAQTRERAPRRDVLTLEQYIRERNGR